MRHHQTPSTPWPAATRCAWRCPCCNTREERLQGSYPENHLALGFVWRVTLGAVRGLLLFLALQEGKRQRDLASKVVIVTRARPRPQKFKLQSLHVLSSQRQDESRRGDLPLVVLSFATVSTDEKQVECCVCVSSDPDGALLPFNTCHPHRNCNHRTNLKRKKRVFPSPLSAH